MAFPFFLSRGTWWHDAIWIGTLYFILLLLALISFPNPHQLGKEKKSVSDCLLLPFTLWIYRHCSFVWHLRDHIWQLGNDFFTYGKEFGPSKRRFCPFSFLGSVNTGPYPHCFSFFCMPSRYIYCSLPPIMLLSLILLYSAHTESLLLTSFAIAGLGCSAMLPLTIGFAQERVATIAPLISGVMIGDLYARFRIDLTRHGSNLSVLSPCLLDVVRIFMRTYHFAFCPMPLRHASEKARPIEIFIHGRDESRPLSLWTLLLFDILSDHSK